MVGQRINGFVLEAREAGWMYKKMGRKLTGWSADCWDA